MTVGSQPSRPASWPGDRPRDATRGTRAVSPALWTAEGWAEEDIDHTLGVLEHFAAYPAEGPHALTRLLGRPPRAFRDGAAEHAEAFR